MWAYEKIRLVEQNFRQMASGVHFSPQLWLQPPGFGPEFSSLLSLLLPPFSLLGSSSNNQGGNSGEAGEKGMVMLPRAVGAKGTGVRGRSPLKIFWDHTLFWPGNALLTRRSENACCCRDENKVAKIKRRKLLFLQIVGRKLFSNIFVSNLTSQ